MFKVNNKEHENDVIDIFLLPLLFTWYIFTPFCSIFIEKVKFVGLVANFVFCERYLSKIVLGKDDYERSEKLKV